MYLTHSSLDSIQIGYIINRTEYEGGTTYYNFIRQSYLPADRGFVVGGLVPTVIVGPGEDLEGAIVVQWGRSADHDGIGTWRNPDDGNIHVDVIANIEDRDEALNLARTLGQIAIWDIEAKEAITL